jgi:fructokinase
MTCRPTVSGLGEILWDEFREGARFGGAAANFASTVAELARDAIDIYVTSSVGPDDLGRSAIEALQGRGVDTSCVALIDRPTGRAFVKLDAAQQARYEFVADAAWDHIPWSDGLQRLAAHADAVCFSTLGQRETSRRTIQRFVRETPPDCLRVLDINLRPPFWKELVLPVIAVGKCAKTQRCGAFGFCRHAALDRRIRNYCGSSWKGFHSEW